MAETILVVEDEPAIRELIGFACESSGYTVLRAGSVQEASDLLSQNRVHLILLDWMLPDLSGLQWLDKLKRDERYAAVPVIMLTARGTESDKVAGLDAGADDYVVKPFSPRELIARIRAVLRRGGAWYDVSPYALLWDDENYYLIGYDSAFSEIRHFRVDKISDLCTAGDGREGSKAFAALDMSAYTSAHFGMFSGTPENIRLECRDTLAGAVIDRFGTDTTLIPSREGYFTVTVPVAVSAPFFGWLCSFGGDIKLLAPESAVDALREHLRKFAEAYQI